MTELSKIYEPEEVEPRIYADWLAGGWFGAEPDPSKEPFCIVIPPPNITGALHLGHALDNTLQDILIRTKRMQGFAALWVPGTDHAGIATQNVVERQLKSEGMTKHDLGREKFVERVWEWKERYGGEIIRQLKRLGISADWSRERFTMDPGLSLAVRKVFVDLYEEGLIYRGNRIINWCPRCETAISDIEVNHTDHQGELVRFRYPLEDGSGHITVATTRLETMLGDTGVAVHPEDQRYQNLIGSSVTHPIHGRALPIISDEAVDMSFGTGAVKMTPAHDQTDFEIAERHGLEKVNILDGRAAINENGGRFRGMDRYAAREAVREELENQGLLEGSEVHHYQIASCDRCETVIEPWLSEQWFLQMKPLADPAIAAVKEGRVTFHPERWTNYYLNWMEQIRDWTISRQLWWGHRIPIWYCDDCGEVWAALEDPTGCRKCSSGSIRQDTDVLDTWFSSQLWPFSVFGWPEASAELDYFYPTSVIVPGYEIIHLWVSRMIMSGLHFMGDVPFRWAFIHGIVRDEHGRKMSKSVGNVIDPIELIDKFGTDALRFTLAEHATGQDIFLHEEWIAGSRNFANKLWNASRFVLMNAEKLDGQGLDLTLPGGKDLDLADRWILSRLDRVIEDTSRQIEAFEIANAARGLYEFIWNEYCDWYIEATKSRLYGDDEAAKAVALKVLLNVLGAVLKLLHPFMPFITEELWRGLPGERDAPSLMVSTWPVPAPDRRDLRAEAAFGRIQQVIGAVRRFRSDHRVPLTTELDVTMVVDDPDALRELTEGEGMLPTLARHSKFTIGEPSSDPGAIARIPVGPVELHIPLSGVMDLDAERARLGKAITESRSEIGRLSAKLSNEGFTSKAPAEVVEQQQRKLDEQTQLQALLVSQLEQLGLS